MNRRAAEERLRLRGRRDARYNVRMVLRRYRRWARGTPPGLASVSAHAATWARGWDAAPRESRHRGDPTTVPRRFDGAARLDDPAHPRTATCRHRRAATSQHLVIVVIVVIVVLPPTVLLLPLLPFLRLADLPPPPPLPFSSSSSSCWSTSPSSLFLLSSSSSSCWYSLGNPRGRQHLLIWTLT